MTGIEMPEIFEDDIRLFDESTRGLSWSNFQKISSSLPFSDADWEFFVGQSLPHGHSFSEQISERILLVAEVGYKGIDVMGTPAIFRQWIDTKIPALQNRRPIHYFRNSIGLRVIRTELGRIEHGIFV